MLHRHRSTARRVALVLVIVTGVLETSCSAAPDASTRSTTRLLACMASATFPYASAAGVDPTLLSVDVYTPSPDDDECSGRPLVVWIHGGGWTSGDKSEHMTDKVRLFNDAGFVFASVNYRLTDPTLAPPSPQHPTHDQDAAGAVAWLVANGERLGVDTTRVAVLGHSAGGGITAAITTDERYLGAHGLPLDAVTCAGSMDGEGYDVTAGATAAPDVWRPVYADAFGTDPTVWFDASPVNHVAPDKGIPRYFVAPRGVDWRVEQHAEFIDALHEAGVPTTVLDADSLSHADLTTLVGAPDDTQLTPPLMDFLRGCFGG
jgi:acetyl esterase/lipase